MSNELQEKLKLLETVKTAVAFDKQLRDKLQIGDKFRFVRDQLVQLADQIEKHTQVELEKEEKKVESMAVTPDEQVVYIYLFNALGLQVPTWQPLLLPKSFFEYSVNRPIYLESRHLESLIRSKKTKQQHAYLSVVVKKADIIDNDATRKMDANNNPFVKVKEGSLRIEKMLGFIHNDVVYILDEDGRLIKKPEDK